MENFDDYVRTRGNALLRFAYVLCGDSHRAEDFVQEALIRCHRRWRRIESRVDPDAYVRKAILRQYLSWRRRRAAGELLTDQFEEHAGPTPTPTAPIEERDEMQRLLAQLSRKQRAVLVLRFYEDLSDTQIADLLGCSPATVRVHASRALTRLREQVEKFGVVPMHQACQSSQYKERL